MTYIVVGLVYLAAVLFGVRFFQHVHQWDDDVRRLSRQQSMRKTERQKRLFTGRSVNASKVRHRKERKGFLA